MGAKRFSARCDEMAAAEELIGIVWRACRKAYGDRVTTIAASVAFFVFLATFPGIAATVALYGIFADPGEGEVLVAALPSVLPEQAVEIIARQARRIAGQAGTSKSTLLFAPLFGFAILLWSTTRGMNAMFGALNTIHDTQERRGFVELTALSLVFTIGFLAFLLLVVGVVFVLPSLLDAIGISSRSIKLLRWPTLLIVVGLSLSLIYRFGSDRENARWRWITIGSATASLLWVCSSILFEWIVSRFGSFDMLYGSLSAVIGFLVWIWLSTIAVLFGAELDAAAERRPRPSVSSRPSPRYTSSKDG